MYNFLLIILMTWRISHHLAHRWQFWGLVSWCSVPMRAQKLIKVTCLSFSNNEQFSAAELWDSNCMLLPATDMYIICPGKGCLWHHQVCWLRWYESLGKFAPESTGEPPSWSDPSSLKTDSLLNRPVAGGSVPKGCLCMWHEDRSKALSGHASLVVYSWPTAEQVPKGLEMKMPASLAH